MKLITKPTRVNLSYHLTDFQACGHVRAIYPAMIFNNCSMHPTCHPSATFRDRLSPMEGEYTNIQFAVFNRIEQPIYVEAIKELKKVMGDNIRIVYDIDDDLLNVPKWNVAHKFFVDRKADIVSAITASDIISVSTEHLGAMLYHYNPNIVVNPNHLPRFIFGNAEYIPTNNKKLRILYAGSSSHFDYNDTGESDFPKELYEYIEKTKDKYEWVFMGDAPKEFKENDVVKFVDWVPVIHLAAKLKQIQPDVAIAPLADHIFNRSKSNIKALESVACGFPILPFNVGPYEGIPHAVNGTEGLIEALEVVHKDRGNLEQIWYDQYDHLSPNLFWEENSNWLKYINRLTRAGYSTEFSDACE